MEEGPRDRSSGGARIGDLVVSITGVRQSSRGGRLVTYYHIETTDGAGSARHCGQAFRRYAQFIKLAEVVAANAARAGIKPIHADAMAPVRPLGGAAALPALPPKIWFNTRPAAILGRQQSLQAYLRGLQGVLPRSPDLWSFVGVQLERPRAAPAIRSLHEGGVGAGAASARDGGEEEHVPQIQYLTEFDWAYHSKDNQMMRQFVVRTSWCSVGTGGSDGSDEECDGGGGSSSGRSGSGGGNGRGGAISRIVRSFSAQNLPRENGSMLDTDMRS